MAFGLGHGNPRESDVFKYESTDWSDNGVMAHRAPHSGDDGQAQSLR